ncbi:MAG: hypothetical protein DIZ78_09405 [endosymbiont of Escarpia spicata]|uniref:Uncharacterized protein n=1 Tax=endosymbiont of Escarpia spicata TaxID=2200908 RepID=A0A370DQE8_9GAMM|nr:MAG: hypothetical protein DIZ78_09405 [endosymbiont of Escarpia spicata]
MGEFGKEGPVEWFITRLAIAALVIVILSLGWQSYATAAPQPAGEMAFVYDAVGHDEVTADCTDGTTLYTVKVAPLLQRATTGAAYAVPIGSILMNGPGIYDCEVSIWAYGAQSPKAKAPPQVVAADMTVDVLTQPPLPTQPERVELWRVKVYSDGSFEIIPRPTSIQQPVP